MNGDLKILGDKFKAKREEMNLSLKEVENATSIRMRYLQAIEAGVINEFLSAVYALGFIKQYGLFLGFDGDNIVQNQLKNFNTKVNGQEFSYGIGTLEVRASPSGGVKWIPNILWIGLFLVVLVVSWYLAKSAGIF